MKKRFWAMKGIGILCSLLLTSSVWAQNNKNKVDLSADAEISEMQDSRKFEAKVAAMGPQKRQSKSLERINKMKAARKGVANQLTSAKNDGESAAVLNCIQGKISPMNTFINTSEQAYIQLKQDDEDGLTDNATKHYVLILTFQNKVLDLARKAKLCLAKDQLADGSGDSRVTEDAGIPNVIPVQPGGYADLIDVVGDVIEPAQIFPFTSFN